jgi:hypothetical protein
MVKTAAFGQNLKEFTAIMKNHYMIRKFVCGALY